MTDLEITELCAEAMGYSLWRASQGTLAESLKDGGIVWDNWNPLHDDAQAMMLVKAMHLGIGFGTTRWYVHSHNGKIEAVVEEDLNRAICESVAKMQEATW